MTTNTNAPILKLHSLLIADKREWPVFLQVQSFLPAIFTCTVRASVDSLVDIRSSRL
jgi:hypothetical protein